MKKEYPNSWFKTQSGDLPDRDEIRRVLTKWEKRIVDYFPCDFLTCDCFDHEVTRQHVQDYLAGIETHSVEVVHQTLRWAPGTRLAEIGPAYGMNLLVLTKAYGFDGRGLEFPFNIKAYCAPIAGEGIPITGFDIYGNDIPCPEGFYDFVILSEVLEHLFVDAHSAIARIRPFLRIGGRLLLTTPNIYRTRNMLRLFRGYNVDEKHPDIPRCRNGTVVDARIHPREYTMFEIAEAFGRDENWTVLKIWCSMNDNPARGMCDFLKLCMLKLLLRFPMKDYIFCVAERTA